jgi:hypothetical protein
MPSVVSADNDSVVGRPESANLGVGLRSKIFNIRILIAETQFGSAETGSTSGERVEYPRSVPEPQAVWANNRLMGTLSAFAIEANVPSDGEMLPVSIFESIPGEILATAES